MSRLLARRLPLTISLYLVLVGLAMMSEAAFHPERAALVGAAYFGHLTIAGVALLVGRWRPGWERSWLVAMTMGCCFAVLLTGYPTAVGLGIQAIAIGHVCLLSGLFVMLPWPWQAQCGVSVAVLVGMAGAIAVLHPGEEVGFAVVGVVTGAVTSVVGTSFLDGYRFEGFVREAELARASTEKQQEADIAETLLAVTSMLSARVSEPDLLNRLVEFATAAVGSDWGSVFVWDDRRRVFRLGGVWEAGPGIEEEMRAVEFDASNLPLVEALQIGEVVEITDAATQTLVPPALLARWGCAAEMVVPLARGETIGGALCFAYRSARKAFSERERRLAIGIAHAASLALETVRLIADLRAANQLKSEFVSTMSHELRTPLGVMLGFAEMGRDLVPPPEVDACLARIEGAGRDLFQLVEATLEMGRIEAGRDMVTIEPITLPALWAVLQRSCSGLIPAPGVVLEWSHELPQVNVATDANKLSVVVRNLVHNGLKFTARGSVRVEAAVGAELAITVRDTGIGIRAEDQALIFDMFRQADGSDSRRYGGVGLGLHIVRRYVERLGGRVEVMSRPGEGAVFTVYLPHGCESAAITAAA